MVIKHICPFSFPNKSHNFRLNFVLQVPKWSQRLLSMNQLCRDDKCRYMADDVSLCIQDKVTGKMLYQGLSNKAVYPLPILKPQRLISHSSSRVAFAGQNVSSELWHCRLGHPAHSVVTTALYKLISYTIYL